MFSVMNFIICKGYTCQIIALFIHCDEAMKISKSLQWKRWNCEKKLRQDCWPKSGKKKFDLEKSCRVPADRRPKPLSFVYLLYMLEIFYWNIFYGVQFWVQMEQIQKKIARIVISFSLQRMVTFNCDGFSLQRFFSLRWIHCLLTSLVVWMLT